MLTEYRRRRGHSTQAAQKRAEKRDTINAEADARYKERARRRSEIEELRLGIQQIAEQNKQIADKIAKLEESGVRVEDKTGETKAGISIPLRI
jgi:hypothetical protein